MRIALSKVTVLLLGVFILSYLFFLVQQLPVTMVMRWLPPNLLQRNSIRLEGASGTLWDGQVAQLRFSGFTLSNLSWRLHGMPMLWGNIALDIKFRQADAFGQGKVNTGFRGQELVMSAVRSSFPAANLMPLFYGFPIALAGQVTADIDAATIRKGEQLSLQGEMFWREAALTAPQPILFGDLQVKLQARDKGTILSVQDQGGPLQLQGNVVLQGDGRYETTITVSARSTASQALAQSISILGPRDAQGYVQILQKGKLPNW